ncbi:50S ribosomal protein L4 [soil metagenome]
MSTFNLYSLEGKKTGTVAKPALFETPLNASLIHRYVLWVRTMVRSNLAHTKTRGEVAGGGRKPHKQKGTGRARSGSIRNPIWRHGGTIFGPRTSQTFATRMNRGERQKALFSALASKSEGVIVLESARTGAKTKDSVALFKALEITGKKVLEIHATYDAPAFKVSSNIPGVVSKSISHANVIDILHADVLLFTKDSLEAFEQHFNPAV